MIDSTSAINAPTDAWTYVAPRRACVAGARAPSDQSHRQRRIAGSSRGDSASALPREHTASSARPSWCHTTALNACSSAMVRGHNGVRVRVSTSYAPESGPERTSDRMSPSESVPDDRVSHSVPSLSVSTQTSHCAFMLEGTCDATTTTRSAGAEFRGGGREWRYCHGSVHLHAGLFELSSTYEGGYR
jgi:hypothetical protein